MRPVNRPLRADTVRFISALTADIAETLSWWATNHPGQPLNPETATGLCGRRFPRSRDGKWLSGVDETLWQCGRVRYGVRQ